MKGEINRDLYCSTRAFRNGRCSEDTELIVDRCVGISADIIDCFFCHRKWPTPEQFKEEYGEEYSDDAPVFVWYRHGTTTGYTLMFYFEAKKYDQFGSVVCACTPWGKPPDNWRPE